SIETWPCAGMATHSDTRPRLDRVGARLPNASAPFTDAEWCMWTAMCRSWQSTCTTRREGRRGGRGRRRGCASAAAAGPREHPGLGIGPAGHVHGRAEDAGGVGVLAPAVHRGVDQRELGLGEAGVAAL